MSAENFVERKIPEYRGEIKKLLIKFGTVFKEKVKEEGPKFLADEIRNLRIPLVSGLLASSIEKTFKQKGGRAINDVIAKLDEMQASNDSFIRVLERKLEYNFSEWVADQKAYEEGKRQQEKPQLQIVNPIVELSYPILDNRLKMVLSNPGKGVVNVSEIYLDVEKWEPAVDVDYTMPAAPLPIVFLKVRLSVDEAHYPLLALNNEQERVYSAKGEGAEKFVVDISSKHNAIFWVRLRIPYFDLTTGQEETIYYPKLDEEAIALRYNYAPGWTRNIEPENLLARSEIYENIANKFKQILIVFQDCHDLGIKSRKDIHDKLYNLGIEAISPGFFLNRFIEVFLSIANLEKRQDMVPTILRLIMYYDDVLHEEQPFHIDVTQFVRLTGNLELQPILEKFIEVKFSEKKQLFKEILSGMRPLG